jgi:MHS family proline/betaine transporter-like MFS transporter
MAEEKITRDAKRAMWTQFLGYGLDAYDMAMVIVLAPVLSKIFTSPKLSEAGQFLMVALLYAVTLAARPLGAAVFGHYADKIGRRSLLVVAIGGVGLMSAICGLIPTPDRIGLTAAYTIFMVARFIMGCFFGGETAVGAIFAIEHAPQRLRGPISGFIHSGFPLGYAIASFVVLGVSLIIGEGAMYEWGWRLMFITAGAAPIGLALYIRKLIVEPQIFQQAKKTGTVVKMPFFTLFKPPMIWTFLQVLTFMTGLSLTNYAVYEFIPKILKGPGKFNLVQYTFIYGVALFCAFAGYFLYGWLTDKYGRRKLTLWYCLYCIALGVPLYKTLIWASVTRSMAIAIVAAILAASLKLAWGMVPAYLSERFPTKTRSVGAGFGYSLGSLLGGAGVTPLVGLFHHIPVIMSIEGPNELWLSASAALTIGAMIAFVGLLFSPETRGIDLEKVGS